MEDARAAYNSYISNLQSNPQAAQDLGYNQAATAIGNQFGKYISPQEYLGALGQIYAPQNGGSSTTTNTAPDPNAAYAQQQAANLADQQGRVRTSVAQSLASIPGSVAQSLTTQGRSLGSGIQDLISGLQSSQQAVDLQGVNAQLAKQQGTRGVLQMVGHGIQSGGVMLANRNAGNSSATEALARAYGTLGRNQLSGVGNQYAQAANNVAAAQSSLNAQTATNRRHIEEQKANVVDSIVGNASDLINQLNSQYAGASLPDRIDLAHQIAQIRQQANDALAQYDNQLQSGISGVQAQTPDQWSSRAASMAQQGIAPDNAFSYSQLPGAQLQGSGPFASSLPLFSLNKKQTA